MKTLQKNACYLVFTSRCFFGKKVTVMNVKSARTQQLFRPILSKQLIF